MHARGICELRRSALPNCAAPAHARGRRRAASREERSLKRLETPSADSRDRNVAQAPPAECPSGTAA
eukprot:7968388-Pyramimonas_sp.AAC.1